MFQDYFIPISNSVAEFSFEEETINDSILKYINNSFPDLSEVDIVFFDVIENIKGDYSTRKDSVRKEFYSLYEGNWHVKIADIGSVIASENQTDLFFAIENIVAFLMKKGILPVVLGGSIELVFPVYKAYGSLDKMMNLSVVTPKFSLGKIDSGSVSNNNYLSKIILEESCNMFNYSNIGYQTYYNSQKNIQLIDSMDFEAYRLGNFEKISNVEPVVRDADAFVIDFKSVEGGVDSENNPNGFTGTQVCAMARYAGMSDKLSSLSLLNHNIEFDKKVISSKLVSQILWYFVEGFSLRVRDYPAGSKEDYLKYIIPLGNDELVFYQSDKSLRWWVRVDLDKQNQENNFLLMPCSHQDYIDATEQKLTDRWLKMVRKLG